jgi:hypothetical protein
MNRKVKYRMKPRDNDEFFEDRVISYPNELMDDTEFDALEKRLTKLVQHATPGPWCVLETAPSVVFDSNADDLAELGFDSDDPGQSERDALYIATFHPNRVRQLLLLWRAVRRVAVAGKNMPAGVVSALLDLEAADGDS